jgi:drug/metabolite transporter (DMT)-like permease
MGFRSASARATAIGMLAPCFWGMSVGIVRSIKEDFGAALGYPLMYGAAFVLMLLIFGRPDLKKFSKRFLFVAIPMANLCAVTFVASMATSDGGMQTVQAGMVNYSWPCLVILFSIVFNGQKARWWVLIGAAVCMIGVLTVMGGDAGLSFADLKKNVMSNPVSYGCAAASALTWAAYSSMTRAWSGGQNPVVPIFFIDFVLFTLYWLWCGAPSIPEHVAFRGWIDIAAGALAFGLAYACWTYGSVRGSLTLLGVASYFTPVLSCIFATFWIGADLSLAFWKGVFLVVAGSVICWLATRNVNKKRGMPIPLRAPKDRE